jgi:hypothetical protein
MAAAHLPATLVGNLDGRVLPSRHKRARSMKQARACTHCVPRSGAKIVTRALVTGGAGFLGSHLCDLLLRQGLDVVALDDFSTGSRENIKHPPFGPSGLRQCVRGDR